MTALWKLVANWVYQVTLIIATYGEMGILAVALRMQPYFEFCQRLA